MPTEPFVTPGRLRLLHIQPAAQPGGAERQAARLLPLLVSHRVDVVVATGPSDVVVRWMGPELRSRPGLGALWLPRLPATFDPHPRLVGRLLQAAQLLDRWHAAVPFHVISASLGTGWALGALLGRRWGIPTIWRAGGLTLGSSLRDAAWVELLVRGLVRWSRPAALVSNATAVARVWSRHTGLPSLVIPNGVQIHPSAEPPPGEGSLLYVGRLTEEKGLDTLLEALTILYRRGANVPNVQMIGPGLTDGVRDRAHRLGIDRWVDWRPASLTAESRMSSARALVLPSRSEGFSNALAEALAWGRPVIASAVGACAELLHAGADGYLIPPADPEALADALTALLRSPQDAFNRGARGRVRLGRWPPERAAAAWGQLVHDLDRHHRERDLVGE